MEKMTIDEFNKFMEEARKEWKIEEEKIANIEPVLSDVNTIEAERILGKVITAIFKDERLNVLNYLIYRFMDEDYKKPIEDYEDEE